MRPQITFDTNVIALKPTRVFWATLCEDTGQRVVLPPTATVEFLRRVRLESERDWARRLRAFSDENGLGWTGVELRRLSTAASVAARDHVRESMRRDSICVAAHPLAKRSIWRSPSTRSSRRTPST